ncbi:TetR/AcrR family transcriptional regulator [Corynebacterium terpenotabidum]|uniref:TetR family transcriptional regulator n=1 Tax=Corynebacterium terpenotabidum Y-11 TaxID=1200352 RepID=S4XF88_9CORY|nr:TetR family transcriptional regulator [Corynebacterium terpenotabidum]AGP31211.1 TetR family transcriptional regulator [Corynebacterium terpenotabidum Y-11]
MTETTNECLGLRERKRRETRLRIEDCATELILDRGFDQVTLEEICEKAGVSRRTFFNYFDSKDQVTSGTGFPVFAASDLDTFAATDCDNVVRDILRFIGNRIDNDPDTSPSLSPDPELSRRISARRRQIVNATPHLMVSGMRRFDDLAGVVLTTIHTHLTTFPGRRRTPDLSAYEEAVLLTSFIRQCLLSARLLHPESGLPRADLLHRVGRDLINLAAAYQGGWD